MKQSFNLKKKIWLTIGILIVGYLISISTEIYLGRKIEKSLVKVEKHLFPMAIGTTEAAGYFQDQISMFEDAVLLGEPQLIDKGVERFHLAQSTLDKVIALCADCESERMEKLEDVQRRLTIFSSLAPPVYHELCRQGYELTGSSQLALSAQRFGVEMESLKAEFEDLSDQFSSELQQALSGDVRFSRVARRLNTFLFLLVLVISLPLMWFVIEHSILTPVKRSLALEKAVEQSRDGMVVLDLDGLVRHANQAWADMHGYDTVPKLQGLAFSDFLEEDQDHWDDYRDQLLQDQALEMEKLHRKQGHATFPVWSSLAVIHDQQGKPDRIVAVARDMSEKRHDEEALRIATDEAFAANQAKSDFLANMSHEIRTPMTAILGFTDLLLQTDLKETQVQHLNKIKNSSDNLLGIINDILDFSKIEAGRLSLELSPIELSAFLEEIVNLFSEITATKKIDIYLFMEPDLPEAIIGDGLRIRQILINLIGNAVKFTKQGRVVLRVSAKPLAEDHMTMEFKVQDTGIGIRKEQLPHLFSPFTQADSSTTRRFGGTGLGLAICSRLVDLMGGTIDVESEFGVGSVFLVQIPVAVSTVGQPRLASHSNLTGKNLRVMVVHQEQDCLSGLTAMVTSFGFSVHSHRQADAAYRALLAAHRKGKPFHLLVSEWNQPFEALISDLIEQKQLGELQTVLVSTDKEPPTEDAARAMGIRKILNEPITPSHLLDSILDVFKEAALKPPSGSEGSGDLVVPNLTGFRVLLAEDNTVNMELVHRLLEQTGLEVILAENGMEVLSRLREQPVDLVLMDVQMPELNGLDTTQAIRRMERFQNLPVIALTAHALVGDREKCFEAGMNDYLSKPIARDELYRVLRSWLKGDATPLESVNALSDSNGDEPPEVLADYDGLDWSQGMKRVGSDRAFYLELIRGFLSRFNDVPVSLKRQISKGEFKEAVMLAHSLKGASGNISATALYNLGSKLEEDLRNLVSGEDVDLSSLDPSLLSIEHEIMILKQNISPLLEELDKNAKPLKGESGPNSQTGSHAAFDHFEQFQELEKLFKENSFDALEAAQELASIMAPHLGPDDSEHMRRVLDATAQFDFDRAHEVLEELLERLMPQRDRSDDT